VTDEVGKTAAGPAEPHTRALRIGVLAIQGDYAAHVSALRRAAADTGAPLTLVLVRKPSELAAIDGLVIPGGESTTFLKFLERDGFLDALQTFVSSRPTFGTCAGSILLANEVLHPAQSSLAVLDATVERNAYGRQNDSAILHADSALGGHPLEMVFIRALPVSVPRSACWPSAMASLRSWSRVICWPRRSTLNFHRIRASTGIF
jgi:pyridoxal 5'-phosphate synthase glutaminase subunit Pdx2